MLKIGDLISTFGPHLRIGIIIDEYFSYEDDIDVLDIFWQDGKREKILPWDIRFLKKV